MTDEKEVRREEGLWSALRADVLRSLNVTTWGSTKRWLELGGTDCSIIYEKNKTEANSGEESKDKGREAGLRENMKSSVLVLSPGFLIPPPKTLSPVKGTEPTLSSWCVFSWPI